MEEPGELQSMGSLESDTTERLHFHFSVSCLVEGNGNLLQCSCLENPMDGGAWWAAENAAAAAAYVSGEGNGTPLQYFCLENPMDGGAW